MGTLMLEIRPSGGEGEMRKGRPRWTWSSVGRLPSGSSSSSAWREVSAEVIDDTPILDETAVTLLREISRGGGG